MHRIIAWNELWKAIHASSPKHAARDRDPAAVWDKRAAAYRRATRGEKRAAEQELALLNLAAGDTVSDVGAGTGCLAAPIACTAANVTAFDPSGGTPAVIREQMAAAGLTNYSTVTMRWEDAVIGRDVEPHGVVIAAFSLDFYDLAAAALRAVYLFWHAGEWRGPGEMALYRAILGEEAAMRKGYPDYIHPVNILDDARIYPNVRIYHAVWDAVYDSPEEAARTWAARHSPDQEDLTPVGSTSIGSLPERVREVRRDDGKAERRGLVGKG
ncbi:class I SAM-dependent methyltransferase [Methanoculleus sp. 10]|uniref:class I SAM-dependent methyltransferase n=1 Tax=Methanoculleus sp. 10 TaxID=430615 RepID=UPI0025D68242|nr:class I SAM-dependent methyltransferase [Methanoculleus sp. 10]